MLIIFMISIILILVHYIFYPVLLLVYSKSKRKKNSVKPFNPPYISFIIPVYNEEKIIKDKITNIYSLNYPKDKFEIIIINDKSLDKTAEIVKNLSKKYENLKFLDLKIRSGKVNAQNEGVKIAKGEIFIFTDADILLKEDSVINLINELIINNASCATGKFVYLNQLESSTSYYESLYQKIENKLKEMESNFYSLTSLSGSLYAIKRKDYKFLDSMFSHDIAMPFYLALDKKITIFVKNAIAFGKSGKSSKEEWQRKVRMFGRVYYFLFKNFKLIFNPFKFDLKFYISFFSHRIIRYLLPLLHILNFISLIFIYNQNIFLKFLFFVHIIIFLFVFFGYLSIYIKFFKPLYVFYYYILFLLSMIYGFIRVITGRIRPYWEVVQSVRNFNNKK
ncbi:MAG: glycosyltransferase [Caldisericia bacterium]